MIQQTKISGSIYGYYPFFSTFFFFEIITKSIARIREVGTFPCNNSGNANKRVAIGRTANHIVPK